MDSIRTTVSVSHIYDLAKLVGLPRESTADKVAAAAVKLIAAGSANQSLEYAISVLQNHIQEHA